MQKGKNKMTKTEVSERVKERKQSGVKIKIQMIGENIIEENKG